MSEIKLVIGKWQTRFNNQEWFRSTGTGFVLATAGAKEGHAFTFYWSARPHTATGIGHKKHVGSLDLARAHADDALEKMGYVLENSFSAMMPPDPKKVSAALEARIASLEERIAVLEKERAARQALGNRGRDLLKERWHQARGEMNEEGLVTTSQAAEILGITDRAVRASLKRGTMTGMRKPGVAGSQWVLWLDDVEALLAERQKKP